MRISDDVPDTRPEGTCDNSPAFQRWEQVSCGPSPEGMDEKQTAQPSLRDSGLSYAIPALKRWAILASSLRDEGAQILLGVSPLSALLATRRCLTRRRGRLRYHEGPSRAI
jgi:hypothetical protein